MACKLQPSVMPYRFTLEGSSTLKSEGISPRITISTDVKDLTSLLKDDDLQQYISAICLITIEDTVNNTTRGAQVEVVDILDEMVSFSIDLSDTMSFNWWDSFTDIWCETYILVNTTQMSEDYSITISEEYLDMKGEIKKTYIIQSGEISDIVIDARDTVEEIAERTTAEEDLHYD